MSKEMDALGTMRVQRTVEQGRERAREREQLWINGIDPDPMRIVESDVAITPQWVADWLGAWAQLDPCGHPRQLVHADQIVTLPDDGLSFAWDGLRVFVQPPYSRPLPWVLHGVDALARRPDKGIVWLLRGDTSTTAARAAAHAAREHGGWAGITRQRLCFGRVDPARPDLPAVFGAPAPFSALVIAAGRSVPAPPPGRFLLLQEHTVVCRPGGAS